MPGLRMPADATELYSPLEIARAAGVALDEVRRVLPSTACYLPHHEAVRIGRWLAEQARADAVDAPRASLFAAVAAGSLPRHPLLPLAVSSSVHVGLVAVLAVLASWGLAPHAATLRADERPADSMR